WPMTIERYASFTPLPPDPAPGRVLHEPATNVPLLEGREGERLANGYVALTPRRPFADEIASLASPGLTRAWLRVASTSWVVDHGRAFRIEDALPRARLVTRARAASRGARELDAIDVAKEALVEGPVAGEPIALPPGRPGEARIVEDRPGRIRVATAAGSEQVLVVSESWHAGWRATVDGAPQPVLRAYGDFLGLRV